LSADIITLSDYRSSDVADDEINLATAVDVAIRDLREILVGWGSEGARQRAEECELTLRQAFSGFVSRKPLSS
jgi:phage terminase large subunit GpA-like protein